MIYVLIAVYMLCIRSICQAKKKMPPAPDPYELDEEGRKIFPWPKSFAEIVQTSYFSTMNLIMEGETRVEVCFPPLPLADLDWNICDLTETRPFLSRKRFPGAVVGHQEPLSRGLS